MDAAWAATAPSATVAAAKIKMKSMYNPLRGAGKRARGKRGLRARPASERGVARRWKAEGKGAGGGEAARTSAAWRARASELERTNSWMDE